MKFNTEMGARFNGQVHFSVSHAQLILVTSADLLHDHISSAVSAGCGPSGSGRPSAVPSGAIGATNLRCKLAGGVDRARHGPTAVRYGFRKISRIKDLATKTVC